MMPETRDSRLKRSTAIEFARFRTFCRMDSQPGRLAVDSARARESGLWYFVMTLVPRERKLDVEQIAENVLRAPPVSWIADSAEPEMRPAETLLVETEVVEVDIDPHIEIDRGQALERSQRVEGHLRILLSIHGDDVLAAATQEFVDSEIFDVPAIREIQPWETLVHRAEHLLKKAHKSRCPS